MSDYVKDLRSLVGNKEVILGCACGCIENEQGEILLQQRNDSGKWGFLGGIMELGESAEETVIREVWEESGLQVRVTKLLGVYSKYFASYPNGDKAQPIVVFFQCQVVGGEMNLANEETLDLQFFHKENPPEIFNQQHKDMLQDVITGTFPMYR